MRLSYMLYGKQYCVYICQTVSLPYLPHQKSTITTEIMSEGRTRRVHWKIAPVVINLKGFLKGNFWY